VGGDVRELYASNGFSKLLKKQSALSSPNLDIKEWVNMVLQILKTVQPTTTVTTAATAATSTSASPPSQSTKRHGKRKNVTVAPAPVINSVDVSPQIISRLINGDIRFLLSASRFFVTSLLVVFAAVFAVGFSS